MGVNNYSRALPGELLAHRFQTSRSQLSIHYALIYRVHAHAAHVRTAADIESAHSNRLDVFDHCDHARLFHGY